MLTVNILPAMAVVVLCCVCLMYFGQWRAQRRLRSVLQHELARIFEQIDLLRFDAQRPAPPRAASAQVADRQRPVALSHGEAYAAAAELAARGADLQELSARCGLGREEARILIAMQGAGPRHANAA
jgi:hypothetical protein